MGLGDQRVRALDAGHRHVLRRQLEDLQRRGDGRVGRDGQPHRLVDVRLLVVGVVFDAAARPDRDETLGLHERHEALPQLALVGVGGHGAPQGHHRAGGEVLTGDGNGGHGVSFLVEKLVKECHPLPGRVQFVGEHVALKAERGVVRRGAAGGEDGGDGGHGEPHVAEPTDLDGRGELVARVPPVSGARVHHGRCQHAVLVVVTQHPHAEPAARGELADRQEVRGVGHGSSVVSPTV